MSPCINKPKKSIEYKEYDFFEAEKNSYAKNLEEENSNSFEYIQVKENGLEFLLALEEKEINEYYIHELLNLR